MWSRRKTLYRLALFFLTLILLGGFHIIDHTWLKSNIFAFKKKGHSLSRAQEHLFLNEGQCKSAFPELVNEIDRGATRGPFTLEKQPADITGLIQARIKNGNLYIISSNQELSQRGTAVLSQLHKAIITSPTLLPDTILALSVIDNPQENAWSFSRSNDPLEKGNYWIMPHFSFWSWPKPFIGTLDEVLDKIYDIESVMLWEEKISKVVWRGTAWYNSAGNTNLRPNLLQVTKGQAWADAEDLHWGQNAENATNIIKIEDFCKYKYIIYTEGVTYSGRLLFHQACASVILTPPPAYLMHTTHLMRPLFSSTLPFHSSSSIPKKKDSRWPISYTPSEANIIFVEPDWSDLEHTITWLEGNPDIAKKIARNQREKIVEAGYLSSAAEVCYWRSLIRAWSEVAQPTPSWVGNGLGTRWETFSLTRTTN